MAYEHLTPRERIHIERAHSQALYYVQRGFYDALRIYAPHIAPEVRSELTGIVGTFLNAYVVSELACVVNEAAEREALPPADARPTAPSIFDPSVPV